MDHTDHHIGRLIDSLEETGELDNTIIFYVVGDNGASAEGGLEGTFSELASLLGVQLGLDSTIDRIDEIGGPSSEPHVPVGWAYPGRPAGKVTLTSEFTPDGSKNGGGTIRLFVNGKAAGEGQIERSLFRHELETAYAKLLGQAKTEIIITAEHPYPQGDDITRIHVQ